MAVLMAACEAVSALIEISPAEARMEGMRKVSTSKLSRADTAPVAASVSLRPSLLIWSLMVVSSAW